MQLLETIVVRSGDRQPRINLYQGDLTRIPREEAVDLLVVSAFPNDYLPSRSSLIGALDLVGISVAELARDKAVDLRAEYGCWLSRPIDGAQSHGFRRILCFEPKLRGEPPEVVGDIFRALVPVIEGGEEVSSIAMPLVASGNQRWPAEAMFEPLLEAAIRWLELGLRLDAIKIVERSHEKAEALRQTMGRFKARLQGPALVRAAPEADEAAGYDVFVSYSHDDADAAAFLAEALREHETHPSVFFDALAIDQGVSWQQKVWEAIESARKVVAMYSPTYLTSQVCQEEYAQARILQRRRGNILVPLYLKELKPELPAFWSVVNYTDVREADRNRLQAAVPSILA